MASKKEIPLKIGQVWKIPIPYGFYGGNGGLVTDNNNVGFYLIKQKNSNGMWMFYRLFTVPSTAKTTGDQIHNRFMHSSIATKYGELVGKNDNLNIDTLKILYGVKE